MIICPRLTIAGLGGDTGKTAVSVGLCRAWHKQGHKVIPFKKGPDYIDMEWLRRGAGHPCFNLDLFLMNRNQVLSSFALNSTRGEIAIIEGNRGLYDGMDSEGSVSTAEIAKLLQSPVVIVVDCTKVTRTAAAMILGCQMLDPQVSIKGVILNRVAGSRHESVIRESIEKYCGLPVIGAIPRIKNITFPGRHLGLLPPQEHPMAEEAIEKAAGIISSYCNTEQLRQIALLSPSLEHVSEDYPESNEKLVNIGVIRDSAFQFYYPENIDALKRAGAELIEFSALTDDLPDSLDALYIGGGFPETHAHELSANQGLMHSIRDAAEQGMPIYAECGGLMYLCEELIWEGNAHPMAGVFPAAIGVSKKPQGHGYTIIEVVALNPFLSVGNILHGHEFHYSYMVELTTSKDIFFAFRMHKGEGIRDDRDGLCYKNVLATYTHLHALGNGQWASGIVRAAANYKKKILIN
jgi:cobyrinic acid a,c-diamide synthase